MIIIAPMLNVNECYVTLLRLQKCRLVQIYKYLRSKLAQNTKYIWSLYTIATDRISYMWL